MVINLNLLRSERGGNPEIVRESEKRRFRDGKLIDSFIEVDKKYRSALFEFENSKKEYNKISKEIGEQKKAVKDFNDPELFEKSKTLKVKISQLECEYLARLSECEKLLAKMGNIVADDVPVSADEKDNLVLREWGLGKRKILESNALNSHGSTFPIIKNGLHHHEILQKLKAADFKRGADIACHRAYFLKGVAVMLNFSILQYGLNFLVRKGYTPIQPPFFLKKEVMEECAELEDFKETLYCIPMNSSSNNSNSKPDSSGLLSNCTTSNQSKDDLYLIATSEQPIAAYYRNEYIDANSLPIRFAGFSSCFRKEAGAHGKDNWGIFRVHQFEKIEQFCITSPIFTESYDSYKIQDDMIKITEEFYQSLELPYRIVSIVSGALNNAASRKYDLEAWFPGYGDYRELVSCSNCTDYQSRNLEIRYRAGSNSSTLPAENNKEVADKDTLTDSNFHTKEVYQMVEKISQDKHYVHMLNGTLVASERALCCILENYQTENGIIVPRPLVPYMGGCEFIPYPT